MTDYHETITIENWGGDCIQVIISENIESSTTAACTHFKLPKRYISTSGQGSFIWVEEKHYKGYWLLINRRYMNDRVIVHEAFHATVCLLQNKGLKLKRSSEEAYAYLLDYIYGELVNITKRAKLDFKKQRDEERSENKK